MKIHKKFFVASLLILISVFGFILALTFSSQDAGSANNETVITKVNVTNSAPLLKKVVLTNNTAGFTTLDLIPGSTALANCTGYVVDNNAANDIQKVNATLYFASESSIGTPDNNIRYVNSSCGSCLPGEVNTNATCQCLFSVWYYAFNGSWVCNMTVWDSFNLSSQNLSVNNLTVNELVAIEVPNELDYGNLSVTELSNVTELNATNMGNVPINISVRGWGGTEPYDPIYNGTCMICQTGNISYDFERYAINATTGFENMTNITNISTTIYNKQIPFRTDDTVHGNASNSTYWQLYIPSDVFGYCNGTLEFTAIKTTFS